MKSGFKYDRVYCTQCDQDMIYSGMALDYPRDGLFFTCEKCKFRIVLFQEDFQEEQ